MVKSVISALPLLKRKPEYPVLKRHINNPNFVVLFTGPGVGVVVNSDSVHVPDVGSHLDTLAESQQYTPFDAAVTLSNA